jgi:hypothetical protein
MQEIMLKAGRMIKHAGWVLGLGTNDSAYTVFERLYTAHPSAPNQHSLAPISSADQRAYPQ